MKKKILSYFLSFLMLLSVLFTQSSTSLYAQENTETAMQSEVQEETNEQNDENNASQELLQEETQQINENREDESQTVQTSPGIYTLKHIDSVSMKINGTQLIADQETKVAYGDQVEIELAWHFTDSSEAPFVSGDQMMYTLPSGIQVNDNGNVINKTGAVVGTYEVKGSNIIITYTDEDFIQGSSRVGSISLNGSLSNEITNNGQGGKHDFIFPGSSTFSIDMERDDSNDCLKVTKEASDAYQKEGGKFLVDYKIAITATGKQSNVKVEDQLGDGLEFSDLKEVVFTKKDGTKVEAKGSVSKKSFTYIIDEIEDGQTIYASYFANLEINSSTFDGDKSSYSLKNKVNVESKEGKKDNTEAKSYYYPIKWLTKEGNKNGSKFTWKITIGDGNVDLGGTILGKDVIEETFIENVSQSGYPSKWYDIEAEFETNIPGLTFEKFKEGGYTFQKGSTEQYYIKYRTYHNPTLRVKNTMTIYVPYISQPITAEKTIEFVGIKNIPSLEKECLTFDPSSRIVEWKVKVHFPKSEYTYAIKDLFPNHMSYVEDSFTFNDSKITAQVQGPSAPYNVGESNFKIFVFSVPYGKAGDYEFTYKTKIDDDYIDKTNTYTNSVSFLNEEYKTIESEAFFTYRPSVRLSKSTTTKYYKSSKTRSSWCLRINNVKSSAKSIEIIDTLPENMTYVEDSLISQYKSAIDVKVSDGQVIFKITGAALDSLKEGNSYELYYQTEIIDINKAIGTNSYTNKAEIYIDENIDRKVEATDKKTLSKDNVLDKKAVYDKTTAPWVNYTVTVNKDELTLNDGNNLKLVDSMGSALDYQIGSMKIDGKDAGDQVYYDVEKHQLYINVSDRKAHTITYSAKVNLDWNQSLQLDETNSFNNVVLSGTSDDILEKKTSLNCKVKKSKAESSSQYVSVNLYKYDNDHQTIGLDGASFTLYECTLSDGVVNEEKVISTQDTNNDGNLSFSKLKRNKIYKLEETKAPDGYIKGYIEYFAFEDSNKEEAIPSSLTYKNKQYQVTQIDSSNLSYQFTVGNKKEDREIGNLSFTKTIVGKVNYDQIKDITFLISGPNNFNQTVKLSEMDKSEKGKYTYTLNNLPTGEYTIIETNANVDGYQLKTNFSLTGNKTTIQKGDTSSIEIINTYSEKEEKSEGTKTGLHTGLFEMSILSLVSLSVVGILVKRKKEKE